MSNPYVDTAIKGAGVTSFGTWIIGVVSAVDWLALGGFVVLVLTFAMNFMFRRREDRRKQEMHEVELAKARKDLNDA